MYKITLIIWKGELIHARIQNVLSEGVQLNSENKFLVDKRERGSKYHQKRGPSSAHQYYTI